MSASAEEHRRKAPQQIRFAVVTVSDTRTLETDKSGKRIVALMEEAGHSLSSRLVVPDEATQISAAVREQVADAVLLTGGTGISRRDRTPEAVAPLFDVQLPGFGELFRMLSYEEIGAAAMLSRAIAGRMGSTLVFCLPGSTAAIELAVQKLIVPEIKHLVFHAQS